MRYPLVVAAMLLLPASSALGQISIQFSLPSVRIGISQPVFPQLVLVPGYPVYYDPGSSANLFFYDGLYWVFVGDNWYASDWYDGPWGLVAPDAVPMFILRVPVDYYRAPPSYFMAWQRDAPPRWGEHWGNDWERHHGGWDRWDRHEAPPPAPLPVYQRQFSGSRYPQPQQQRALRSQHYRHEPRETTVRQVLRAQPPPTQPQRAQPQATQPQATQPQATQPQATPPQRAQPQMTQPQRTLAEPARAAPNAPRAHPQEKKGKRGRAGAQEGRKDDASKMRGGAR